MALFGPLLAAMAVVVTAPSVASAQTLTSNCWQTATSGGGTACYASADGACYKQFQEFAYTQIGPYQGVIENGIPFARGCSWVWHIGDSDPTNIYWLCSNGYFAVLGQCPGDNLPSARDRPHLIQSTF